MKSNGLIPMAVRLQMICSFFCLSLTFQTGKAKGVTIMLQYDDNGIKQEKWVYISSSVG